MFTIVFILFIVFSKFLLSSVINFSWFFIFIVFMV
ncbi:Uncharacterised protein [Mycobacteroides abscessus subsp. abscessus]|nr:Uncharacterised protein [Mycobacteroides abscessus subsp. abscessus]